MKSQTFNSITIFNTCTFTSEQIVKLPEGQAWDESIEEPTC